MMGDQDLGKDSDKDIGKSNDGSDKTTDRLRDVTRDVTSLNLSGKYEALKDYCVKQFGPMSAGGWLSLNDPDTFNARTNALASGTPQEILDAINKNVSGAKAVQALLPAIGAKIAQIKKTSDTET
jgi:hypothetical protein